MRDARAYIIQQKLPSVLNLLVNSQKTQHQRLSVQRKSATCADKNFVQGPAGQEKLSGHTYSKSSLTPITFPAITPSPSTSVGSSAGSFSEDGAPLKSKPLGDESSQS